MSPTSTGGPPLLLFVCDIDDTITGPTSADADTAAFRDLWASLCNATDTKPQLVYNSGRNLWQAYDLFSKKEGVMPLADILVCGCGTRIFFRSQETGEYKEDAEWTQQLTKGWDLEAVLCVLEEGKKRFGVDNFYHGEPEEQLEHKQTMRVQAHLLQEVLRFLQESLGPDYLLVVGGIEPQWRSVDVLPGKAGKGSATEYLRQKLGVPYESTVVAGDSGNDIGMLMMPGASWHGIVVSNAVPDLLNRIHAHLDAHNGASGETAGRLVLSSKPRSAGVVDGLRQLGFFK